MNRINKKSGFTLIEIIVVLIIVGVLAAIALPNLFGQVERNRSQEALTTLSTIKAAVETCIVMNNNTWVGACTDPANIGFTLPGGSQFTYTIAAGPAAPGYAIIGAKSGIPANTVALTRAAGGAVSCDGNGSYEGVCR